MIPKEVELALEMGPARRESETFEQYKKRRFKLNDFLSRYLEGTPIFFTFPVDSNGNRIGAGKVAINPQRQLKREMRGNLSSRQWRIKRKRLQKTVIN